MDAFMELKKDTDENDFPEVLYHIICLYGDEELLLNSGLHGSEDGVFLTDDFEIVESKVRKARERRTEIRTVDAASMRLEGMKMHRVEHGWRADDVPIKYITGLSIVHGVKDFKKEFRNDNGKMVKVEVEFPTTIKGFLEAFRRHSFPMYKSDSYYKGMTEICAPRLNEIVNMVLKMPKDAFVPKSIGWMIHEYINTCEDKALYFGDYDLRPHNVVPFRYHSSKSIYTHESIMIPSRWLVCPMQRLKALVEKEIHKEV